jgi:hypothetical protein
MLSSSAADDAPLNTASTLFSAPIGSGFASWRKVHNCKENLGHRAERGQSKINT